MIKSTGDWNDWYADGRQRTRPGTVHQHVVDQLGAALGGFAGKRILEIGAGKGATVLEMARLGAEVWALELSAPALELIHLNMRDFRPDEQRRVLPIQADAFHLPFRSATLDAIFHQGFLEHFADPGPLLDEQRRVLRPGGFLFTSVPQKYNLFTLFKKPFIWAGRWRYGGWETEYSHTALSSLLKKSRFEVVNKYGCGSFWLAVLKHFDLVDYYHRESGGSLREHLRLRTALEICVLARKA